jgi:hypothetical protein
VYSDDAERGLGPSTGTGMTRRPVGVGEAPCRGEGDARLSGVEWSEKGDVGIEIVGAHRAASCEMERREARRRAASSWVMLKSQATRLMRSPPFSPVAKSAQQPVRRLTLKEPGVGRRLGCAPRTHGLAPARRQDALADREGDGTELQTEPGRSRSRPLGLNALP